MFAAGHPLLLIAIYIYIYIDILPTWIYCILSYDQIWRCVSFDDIYNFGFRMWKGVPLFLPFCVTARWSRVPLRSSRRRWSEDIPAKKLASNFVELRQTSLSVDHADYLSEKIMEDLMRRGHQHLVESERVRKDIPPSSLKRQGAQYFDDWKLCEAF